MRKVMSARWLMLVGLGSALALATACSSDDSNDTTPNPSQTGDAGSKPGTGTNDAGPAADAGGDIDAGTTGGGITCDTGTTNCNGTCVATQTDTANCGACGNVCGKTEACGSGACAVLANGNGADGAFAPAENATINTVHAGGAAVAAGAKVVTVTATTGFTVGDLVLLHQTRGANAGKFDVGEIAAIDANANTLTLVRAVTNTYASAGDVDRAQVVKIPQYTTVTIGEEVTVDAPAWDGASGGILAFRANGAVSIAGTVTMSARGFRGYSHASVCTAGTRFFCTNANTANGFTGESATGPSAATVEGAANGGGGAGGPDGQDCGGGAGGSYGSAGTAGAFGGGGNCRAGTAGATATAGALVGDADLTKGVFFGAAGGEGGADEDGAFPGRGGNGGGVILLDGASITVTGRITSAGEIGQDGTQNFQACGGVGSGMGAGGGGAGGAIVLRATGAVAVGSSRVSATGSTGGQCWGQNGHPGGSGGNGRIAVVGGTVTGTTNPGYPGGPVID